jgi:hypothetical protein
VKRLHRQGKLKLPGVLATLHEPRALEAWLTPLYRTNWEVYCQPPPEGITDPEAVLKYVARYVVGGAISDRRLISHGDGQVTFWARQGKGKKRRPQPLSLPGVEFVRRFLLHVLPSGFHRVRYYGLLSNSSPGAPGAHCRKLLSGREAAPLDLDCEPSDQNLPAAEPACPSCGRGVLILCESQPPPSWRQLLARSPYAAPLRATVQCTYLKKSPSKLSHQDSS